MTLSFNNYHSASFVLPSSPRRAAIHDEGTKLFSKTVILVLDNIRNYYVELLINWIKILNFRLDFAKTGVYSIDRFESSATRAPSGGGGRQLVLARL